MSDEQKPATVVEQMRFYRSQARRLEADLAATTRERDGAREALKDQAEMHSQHVQQLEASRLRLEAELAAVTKERDENQRAIDDHLIIERDQARAKAARWKKHFEARKEVDDGLVAECERLRAALEDIAQCLYPEVMVRIARAALKGDG